MGQVGRLGKFTGKLLIGDQPEELDHTCNVRMPVAVYILSLPQILLASNIVVISGERKVDLNTLQHLFHEILVLFAFNAFQNNK